MFVVFAIALSLIAAVLPVIVAQMPLLVVKITTIMSFQLTQPLLVYVRKPHLRYTLRRSIREALANTFRR